MSQMPQFASLPIKPIYVHDRPNAQIDLGKMLLEFAVKGTSHKEMASATMRFSPTSRLEFVCPLDAKEPSFGYEVFDAEPAPILLPSRGESFEGYCSAVGQEHGGIVFVPTKSAVVVTSPATAITKAIVHVFNFPKFLGPDDFILTTQSSAGRGMHRLGQVVLRGGDWKITIAATDKTNAIADALKVQGGHAITHVAEVERADQTPFTSDQLEDALTCLQYFLSFALGRWAGVSLPVGLDASGARVHERWGMPISAEGTWNGSCSWFDQNHGELLAEVFPGFYKLWSTPIWRQPLTHSLYWYLAASDRGVGSGVDVGLILAQTALEGLSWTYCVQDRKMVSPEAFGRRGLSASNKLRLLASSLSIPTDLPPGLKALNARPGKPWSDSMDAITSIRNSLVHSDPLKNLPDKSYFEACMLSLWLIDLVMLRLCAHVGNYANRLSSRWTGQVEPAPWK